MRSLLSRSPTAEFINTAAHQKAKWTFVKVVCLLVYFNTKVTFLIIIWWQCLVYLLEAIPFTNASIDLSIPLVSQHCKEHFGLMMPTDMMKWNPKKNLRRRKGSQRASKNAVGWSSNGGRKTHSSEIRDSAYDCGHLTQMKAPLLSSSKHLIHLQHISRFHTAIIARRKARIF